MGVPCLKVHSSKNMPYDNISLTSIPNKKAEIIFGIFVVFIFVIKINKADRYQYCDKKVRPVVTFEDHTKDRKLYPINMVIEIKTLFLKIYNILFLRFESRNHSSNSIMVTVLNPCFDIGIKKAYNIMKKLIISLLL